MPFPKHYFTMHESRSALRKLFRAALARWKSDTPAARSPARMSSAAEPLRLEPLEHRYSLSGNVNVAIDGDDVRFFGDELGNNVEVSVSAGNIIVTGKDNTTINGETTPFTLKTGSTQIDGIIQVRLFDGDDTFVIKDIEITQTLRVYSGNGDDNVGLDDVTIGKSAFFVTQSGDDGLVLRNSTIGGYLVINLGGGDDTLNTENLTVGADFLAVTGTGIDVVVIDHTTAHDRLKLWTGPGEDTTSIVDSTIDGTLKLRTGRLSDFISIQSTSIGNNLKIFSSGGDDAVVLGGNTSIGSRILNFSGPGADALQIGTGVTFAATEPTQNGAESNSVPSQLISERLDDPQTGANARVIRAREALDFPPPTPLELSISTVSNTTVASHETLLTTGTSFTITGSTAAGSAIAIARDGDQVFDDGTTTADGSGNFSIDVTLTHNDTNRGENPIVVRATDEFGRTTTQSVQVHLVVGTVVRMQTNLGFIDLELLDDDAPTFVDNFMGYFADYTNSLVHRVSRQASDGLGLIQGGGFVVNGTSVTAITTDPAIDNDFDPSNLNIRGSVSMARLDGDVNSATSQWFINSTDNANLDVQQFTVFGHVITSSLSVVDAIAALSDFDVRTLTGVSALKEVPLQNYSVFSEQIAGTVSTAIGSTTVAGSGTQFTTSIPADKRIRIAGQTFLVATINSDVELTLASPATATGSGLAALVNALPISTQYVTTSSVSELAGLL